MASKINHLLNSLRSKVAKGKATAKDPSLLGLNLKLREQLGRTKTLPVSANPLIWQNSVVRGSNRINLLQASVTNPREPPPCQVEAALVERSAEAVVL